MNAKKYVNPDNQIKNIEKFKESLDAYGIDMALLGLSFAVNANHEQVKVLMINNVKVVDTEIYKKYFPIFLKLYTDNFNNMDLLGALGFTEDQIAEFSSENPDKEKLLAAFSSKLGVDFKLGEKIDEAKEKEVLKNISDKVGLKESKEMSEKMYFSEQDINRILNGITEYVNIDAHASKSPEDLKDYLSMQLYKDAFEIYLKVLKELYSKINKVAIKTIRNDVLYDFYQNNHSELLDSTNNKLRNDVCHLNYDERGKYTREQIDEDRNDIILMASTALIAKNEFVVNFMDKSINTEKRMEKLMDAVLSGLSEEDLFDDSEESEEENKEN